jgi:hypothetical protein
MSGKCKNCEDMSMIIKPQDDEVYPYCEVTGQLINTKTFNPQMGDCPKRFLNECPLYKVEE